MTPLETRLWKALNVEPDEDGTRGPPNGWTCWRDEQAAFAAMHSADRLAYFEGKVREAGWRLYLTPDGDGERVDWFGPDNRPVSATAPTEHTARLTAAARALVALGIVEEIVDG